MSPSGNEFVAAGRIYIRNESGNTMQAFVTHLSASDGDDSWYIVPASFSDDSIWNRPNCGWELIAFADDNHKRVGFYVAVKDVTTYVTFHSFDNVEIHRVAKN